MPYTPGAVLGPNSKTRRSKPGLCAIRMAVSCAWFPTAPPVRSGQALAGVLPGLAAAVGVGGAGVGEAVVGAAVVGVMLADRVGVGVAGAEAGWLALGLDRGRTTRSGPQALTTTTPIARKRAP